MWRWTCRSGLLCLLWVVYQCCNRLGHRIWKCRHSNEVHEWGREATPNNGGVMWHTFIFCSIFLCLEFKVVDKTFGVLVIPLYENYVVLFSVLLCICCRICLFGPVERAMTESEPSLGNMWEGLGNIRHLCEWGTSSWGGAIICKVDCITPSFLIFSSLGRTLSESWMALHWGGCVPGVRT